MGSHISGVKVGSCVLCLEKESRVKGSDSKEGNSRDDPLTRSSGGNCGSMLWVPVAGKRVESGGREKGSENEVGRFAIDATVGEVRGGHQQ